MKRVTTCKKKTPTVYSTSKWTVNFTFSDFSGDTSRISILGALWIWPSRLKKLAIFGYDWLNTSVWESFLCQRKVFRLLSLLSNCENHLGHGYYLLWKVLECGGVWGIYIGGRYNNPQVLM